MAVDLEILPRKSFALVLADGSKVEGQFGTWALARFGAKRKIGLSGIQNLFNEDQQLTDLIDFVLCAIEFKERESKKPIAFSDVSFCAWMDEYAEAKGVEALTVLTQLMMLSAGTSTATEDEKKSLPNGTTSSEHTTAQEEA